MKKFILIFAITFMAKTHAQDPQLFENTWYLQKVVIDSEEHLPPSNDEVNFVGLNFYESGFNDFFTTVCNNFTGSLIYDNVIQNFIFNEFAITLLECDIQENGLFEGLYFGFYLNEIEEPFPYTITIDGNNNKMLVITNLNGDEAFYGDQLLTNRDFSNTIFSIYPSPVKEELNLKSLSNGTGNLEIKIYDLTGKLLISTFSKTDTTINMGNLKQGLYFIVVENSQGNIQTEKFVKI